MVEVSETTLRQAKAGEHQLLTDLCLRSKASWGYNEAFMKSCRSELSLTATDCLSPNIQVAERHGTPVGLAEIHVENDRCALEKLFVEPDMQHDGVGRVLMQWAIDRCKALKQNAIIIEADPGAESFYERFGAVRDGLVQSRSIPDRQLPRLILKLD